MVAGGKISARWMVTVLVVAWVSTPSATGQGLTYLRRLELPVAGDSIGYPRSVEADLHINEIFVCDSRRNRILIYDLDGRLKFQIPGGDVFSAPMDIAVDPEGYLLVVANHQQRRTLIELDFDGLFLGEKLLDGLPSGLVEPKIHSVALSPAGDRMYVVDVANNRLWIAERDGAIETSIDLAPGMSEKEKQDVILGHVDVYGDSVLMAVRSAAAIRIFDLDGTDRGSVGERGGGFCRLSRPVAAALTDGGEMIIVDQQRMVITRWVVAGNRCVDEYFGLGNLPGYLYFPLDVALDGNGQLYVTQGFEGRVQMYEGMAPAVGPPRVP